MGKERSKQRKLKSLGRQLVRFKDQGDVCEGGNPDSGHLNSGGPGGYGGGFFINISMSKKARIVEKIKTLENSK